MTLDYGKYGMVRSMGNAGFISSTVAQQISTEQPARCFTHRVYRQQVKDILIQWGVREAEERKPIWEFPKMKGTLFWCP